MIFLLLAPESVHCKIEFRSETFFRFRRRVREVLLTTLT